MAKTSLFGKSILYLHQIFADLEGGKMHNSFWMNFETTIIVIL